MIHTDGTPTIAMTDSVPVERPEYVVETHEGEIMFTIRPGVGLPYVGVGVDMDRSVRTPITLLLNDDEVSRLAKALRKAVKARKGNK